MRAPVNILKHWAVKAVLPVLFMLVIHTAVKAQDAAITIIGHVKGAPIELKMPQLQSILKGEKQRWSDGTKVVIALMNTNTPIGSSASKKIFNMKGDQVKKYWLSLVFQGKADAPTYFNSVSDLELFVSQTPGAIGITGPSTSATKIIVVDGRKSI